MNKLIPLPPVPGGVNVPHGRARGGILGAPWVKTDFYGRRYVDVPTAAARHAVPPSHQSVPVGVGLGAAFIDPDPPPHAIASYAQARKLLGIFDVPGPVSAHPLVHGAIPTAAPEWVTYQELPRQITGAGACPPAPMGAWPDDLAPDTIFGGA